LLSFSNDSNNFLSFKLAAERVVDEQSFPVVEEEVAVGAASISGGRILDSVIMKPKKLDFPFP
jgi:hypothetical protein